MELLKVSLAVVQLPADSGLADWGVRCVFDAAGNQSGNHGNC